MSRFTLKTDMSSRKNSKKSKTKALNQNQSIEENVEKKRANSIANKLKFGLHTSNIYNSRHSVSFTDEKVHSGSMRYQEHKLVSWKLMCNL